MGLFYVLGYAQSTQRRLARPEGQPRGSSRKIRKTAALRNALTDTKWPAQSLPMADRPACDPALGEFIGGPRRVLCSAQRRIRTGRLGRIVTGAGGCRNAASAAGVQARPSRGSCVMYLNASAIKSRMFFGRTWQVPAVFWHGFPRLPTRPPGISRQGGTCAACRRRGSPSPAPSCCPIWRPRPRACSRPRLESDLEHPDIRHPLPSKWGLPVARPGMRSEAPRYPAPAS